MRYLLIFFLIIQCSNVFAFPEEKNGLISLNGTWKFRTDPNNIGENDSWFKDEYNKTCWDSLQVPGNWDVKNEYAKYAGKAWLSKEFIVNKEWNNKNVRILFESVYNEAKIWINGKKIGENQLGFLPFTFEINQYLKFGELNKIVVLVDNTFKRGAMWNWGGIRRPVYLEITDKSRLEYQHITALPDLSDGTAQIDLLFEIHNFNSKEEKLNFEWEIINDGKVVWKQKKDTEFNVLANENRILSFRTKLSSSKVKLWHFNDPNLYTSRLRLYRGNELIHTLSDRFGIRKVEIDGQNVKLNGEIIRTVGFNIVADDRTNGNTLPLWRIMEDVDLMKSAGANMARLSHQPIPKEFLNYLDEKGIMTFEEVALWGKDEMVDPEHPIPKEWLRRMVKNKYNHPSIIGWSVGNEIGFLNINPKVMDYVKGAIQQAKELDPHRLAVYVTHSSDIQKTDATQFSDLIMLNKYSNWGERAEKTHSNQSGKPIFYSEFGHKITSEDPNLGIIDVHRMLSEIRDKSYLMGASYWTFNDYRSSYSGTPPSENRSWGIVNVFRQQKRAYYDFQKEYAPIKEVQLDGFNEVKLIPRSQLDIPSYIMHGYRLVWEANDNSGKLIDGGFLKLSEIKPGDQPLINELKWNRLPGLFSSVKVSLLDPHGYCVYDTIAYFKTPEQPRIISTHSDSKTIRVIFEKHPLASAWKVKYTVKGVVKETKETINDFIEIENINVGDTCRIQLVAINNFGESTPSIPQIINTSNHELPPVIWNTEASDKEFFIGYSVDPKDYLYQIQYGINPGDYENFHTIQVRTAGVCNISGLNNGQIYYYRMRRLMQWGFASDWTHEIKVRVGDSVEPPKTIGYLRSGNEALLIFESTKKVIGYKVRYINKAFGKTEYKNINASQINYTLIKGLSADEEYSFEIAAIMPTGISAYSMLRNR